MKDWLGDLLKVKAHVKRQTTPASEAAAGSGSTSVGSVFEAYRPFLATLAQTNNASMESVVSDALFHYLSDKADAIADSEALAALSVDTSEFVSPKSGALDKVSDDCLKLALSYLSISDRCVAERSCKRLFHLSREFWIECECFNKVVAEFGAIDAKCVVRVASRLCPMQCDGIFTNPSISTRSQWPIELKRKVMAHLQNHIQRSHLSFGHLLRDSRDVFLAATFPKLEDFSFISEDSNSCREYLAFLKRHSSNLTSVRWLRQPQTDPSLDCAILRCLSEMSNLRSLNLKGTISVQVSDCEFPQIESLALKSSFPMPLATVKHMIHGKLRELELSGTFDCCRVRLPMVRKLRLDISRMSNWHHVLDGLNSAIIQQISSVGYMTTFPKLFAEAKRFNAEMRFRAYVFWDAITEAAMNQIVAELKKTPDSSDEMALKQLTIRMHSEENMNIEEFPPQLPRFLQCLGSLLGCFPPLSLEISANWWQTAKPQMDDTTVAALEPLVTFIECHFS